MVFSLPVVSVAGSSQGLDQNGLGDRTRAVAGGRSGRDGLFKSGQGHAGVARRPTRELVDQFRREARFQIRQTALLVVEGAADDRGDFVRAQRLEDDHAAPREQGRVDLERWVLGRGPDQADRAVLDRTQEGVLLCLVEAMDLVDEEDRPGVAILTFPCKVDGRSNLAHAGKDCRERDEFRSILPGDQAGEGCLAGPGRSPENERWQLGVRPAERRTQERLCTDDVGLAHELIERAGPHPFGQRGIGTAPPRAPRRVRQTGFSSRGVPWSRPRCDLPAAYGDWTYRL